MISFQNFPSYPNPGEVSICERDGRLCTLPVTEIDLSKLGNANLHSYPDINISRELFHYTASSSQPFRDDGKTAVLMPVNETLIKRITRTFFEEGLVGALSEASSQSRTANPILGVIAKYALSLVEFGTKIECFFQPHRKDQGIANTVIFSQTRDWPRSLIRSIKWHPNYFKIAVAALDDSVRIYGEDSSIVPVIKSSAQKNITAMAWRPYSAGELAVGCQSGILVWTIDPNSHITRPLSQAVHLTHKNHSPVLALEWNEDGTLLATSSTNSSDILMWDVDQSRNVPLKRVGPPCSLLQWSPDGSRLFSSTVANVFRVWSTTNWTPDRWTVPYGSIQSAVWSPCGAYLLFVTTAEPLLYSLRFVEEQLFATETISKQALPIADLTKINVGHTDVGGRPQSLAWDPAGRYLAIIFKDSSAIAIFLTAISKNQLSIAPDCILVGMGAEVPAHICFKEIYKNDKIKQTGGSSTILTIGWSSGRVQYFPFD